MHQIPPPAHTGTGRNQSLLRVAGAVQGRARHRKDNVLSAVFVEGFGGIPSRPQPSLLRLKVFGLKEAHPGTSLGGSDLGGGGICQTNSATQKHAKKIRGLRNSIPWGMWLNLHRVLLKKKNTKHKYTQKVMSGASRICRGGKSSGTRTDGKGQGRQGPEATRTPPLPTSAGRRHRPPDPPRR